MFSRFFVNAVIGASLIAASSPAVRVKAQAPAPPKSRTPGKAWTPGRTPWGDPDLQGVWTSDSENGVPFERPEQFAGKSALEGQELDQLLEQRAAQRSRNAPLAGGITGAGPTHWYENWDAKSARTSMIVDPADGRVPPQTDEGRRRAAALAAARAGRGPADSYEDRSLWDRCITRGVPNVMFPTIYNNNSRIVQGPGYVAVTYEMIHETRIIPLDGRQHIHPSIRGYLGDARGRWEGGTLVVDTTNFSDKTNYRGASSTLHLIERFTRTGANEMRYEVTVEDPQTFTRPWTAALNLTAQSDLFEYACHEGNYGLSNILSAGRAEDRDAAAAGRAPSQVDTRGEER
jgi:hypothetical protein